MSHSPTVHPQLPTVGLLWANLDIRWCPRCSMSHWGLYVYVWRLTFTPMLCPQQTDFLSPWRWPSALKKTTRRWLTSRLSARSSRTLNTLNESAALTPLTFHHTEQREASIVWEAPASHFSDCTCDTGFFPLLKVTSWKICYWNLSRTVDTPLFRVQGFLPALRSLSCWLFESQLLCIGSQMNVWCWRLNCCNSEAQRGFPTFTNNITFQSVYV